MEGERERGGGRGREKEHECTLNGLMAASSIQYPMIALSALFLHAILASYLLYICVSPIVLLHLFR